MAEIFDLSSYLEEKKSKIVLGNKEYEIKDGFKTLIKLDDIANKKDSMEHSQFLNEFLSTALGEEAAKELIDLNLKTAFYMKVVHCIEQAFMGEEQDTPSETGNLV